MSLAMVVGSMIGSGIYLLPTTLAPFGYNLVVAFLLTGFGTMCLAFAMARLAAVIPGGPFVYVDQCLWRDGSVLDTVELRDFADYGRCAASPSLRPARWATSIRR